MSSPPPHRDDEESTNVPQQGQTLRDAKGRQGSVFRLVDACGWESRRPPCQIAPKLPIPHACPDHDFDHTLHCMFASKAKQHAARTSVSWGQYTHSLCLWLDRGLAEGVGKVNLLRHAHTSHTCHRPNPSISSTPERAPCFCSESDVVPGLILRGSLSPNCSLLHGLPPLHAGHRCYATRLALSVSFSSLRCVTCHRRPRCSCSSDSCSKATSRNVRLLLEPRRAAFCSVFVHSRQHRTRSCLRGSKIQ